MAVNLNRTPKSIGGKKAKITITRLSDKHGHAVGKNSSLATQLRKRITAAKTQFRLHEEVADFHAEITTLKTKISGLKNPRKTVRRAGKPDLVMNKTAHELARDRTQIAQMMGRITQCRILIRTKQGFIKKVDQKVNPKK